MASTRDRFLAAFDAAEQRFDQFKATIGEERQPVIVPFRGHATDTTAFLKGRVLEDPGLTTSTATDSIVENAFNMLRRFESDEIPGARLRIELGGAHTEVETDEEGYFRVHLDLPEPLPAGETCHSVSITLLGTPRRPEATAHATGEVVTVPVGVEYGVISDVDDTVLQTGATNFLRMLRTTVLSNAQTRLPFEGVAGLYRSLAYGTGSTMDNPVYYVSSSPWNLYDLITDFLHLQGLPRGPVFLRDLGISKDQFIKSSHGDHKLAAIRDLMQTHPHLPFILVGDSGQHDPEIYATAAREFPGRIPAVVIRDVTGHERDEAVRTLARALDAEGIPLCLAADSLEAGRFLAARGLIAEARLADVAAEKAKDQAPAALAEGDALAEATSAPSDTSA